MAEHFEVYEGRDGEWYWRLRDANGEPVASGEGYMTEAGARDGVRDVVSAACGAAGLLRDGYLREAVAAGVESMTIERLEG